MYAKINHIGIVTKSIEKYLRNAGYDKPDLLVDDPVQQAFIALVRLTDDEIDIELIEPWNEEATTYNFLKKTGGGLHHICYELDNENELDELFQKRKIKKIFGPVEAIAFNRRKVVFGYTRNREIVEFLLGKDGTGQT